MDTTKYVNADGDREVKKLKSQVSKLEKKVTKLNDRIDALVYAISHSRTVKDV